MNDTFRLPGEIRFGPGISGTVGEEARRIGARRVAVITDPGIIDADLLGPIERALAASGLRVSVFSDVSPNPRDYECLSAASFLVERETECVVALGGGSPIDLAKAAVGIATNGGTPQDWVAPKTFVIPPLPLIAIPTTAGTGSEVTRSSVINDTTRQVKISLRDSQIAPRIALVDYDLTMSLPPTLTAATGMDALTHAVEAYTGKRATAITDGLALQAIRMIAGHLPAAVSDGRDRKAREAMMMASVIAGMAFSNADVAAVHCIAEAIGGRYDTPHGVANSLFLPYLFAYNSDWAPERNAQVAVALGVATPDQRLVEASELGAQFLSKLAAEIGIPPLKDIPGIAIDDFPWIAAASAQNLSNSSNARPMSETDYLQILDQAWQH
ncbi:iron-containing alcohol dehydrogenase [soil metagenome]